MSLRSPVAALFTSVVVVAVLAGAVPDRAVLVPVPERSALADDGPRRASTPSRSRVPGAPALMPDPASVPPPEEADAPTSAPVPPTIPLAENGPPRYFAGVENLGLRLPPHVIGIGFHESADRRALSLHPVGVPRVNDNLPRLHAAPVALDGPEYTVMRTRRRGGPPTSAVDLAMPFNHPVRSPVSGVVAQVRTFALYGRVPDNMIVITPDSRPDLHVILMHVNGVRVEQGQRVEAGETLLALTARLLPFDSQIDRYMGTHPHIHVELRPAS